MGNTILRLGAVDQGAAPADKKAFLEPYHASMADTLKRKQMFRDEANGVWRSFLEVPGKSIRELQQFLKDAGFMPKANVDGIFGYATHAAARLFQEYIRTVKGDPGIGVPDGVVGPKTWGYIDAWKTEATGRQIPVCEWATFTGRKTSPEFRRWIALLKAAKKFYQKNENPIVTLVEAYARPTDTKKVGDWDHNPKTIHLIGIRRTHEIGAPKRENDDLFVLLINGMAFKFWGSTDPNPGLAERADIPFLVEGQHEYQFGWHKISNNNTIYRALRPAGPGVLVFRDRDGDRALTESDIGKGLDSAPNTTINIHWSGIGATNFSAGCQVIAGRSYINHQGQLIDCSPFAAVSYGDLAAGKTRGAYNVFTDLVLTYAPPKVRTLRYMLGRDESFRNFKGWDDSFIETEVSQLRRGRAG